MLAPVLVAALLASTAAGLDSACPSAEGLDPLLRPGQVLLLGELHGTNEVPEFVATVACHAMALDLPVTVALELPTQEEAAIRDPATSVVELHFWAKGYQDGRTSAAMRGLIEQVRAMNGVGLSVDLILIDDPSNFRARDAHMAKRLLEAVAASPEGFVVALTGNIHNRTAAGSGRMGELVSKALGSERVTSLKMTHAGGSAWICEATAGCGPLDFGEREADPTGTVRLFETPDPRGYDGTFSVGSISASPPAKDARAGIALSYLDSFTTLRTSESGHVYAYEFWLWSSGPGFLGAYLYFGGLQGDGMPPTVEPIKRGLLQADGTVALETSSHRFSGRLEGDCLTGVLRQGPKVVWGGEDGRDEITLCRGTSFPGAENPGREVADLEALHALVGRLMLGRSR